MQMIWIRISQWAIRITLASSFMGILVVALLPGLTVESRIISTGIALQIAGISLALPELAQKLSNRPATDLIIWAETFFPFWKILSRVHLVTTLGRLSIILSIIGIALIIIGLLMQYLAVFFSEGH
jgi:hypothetical protein